MMTFKMSLKISFGWRKGVEIAIWSVLAILFLVFFIRVATWEDAYYRRMEGSERDIVGVGEVATDEEELIEVEPTEEEVKEYVVLADRPRYLTIEKIGVYNARVLAVGVNAEGALDTPRNIYDVGWYDASGKPGEGKVMMIDGHNGGPRAYGVFKRLPELVEGDIITVERGDGAVYKYSVVENIEVPLSQSDKYMSIALRSPVAGKEALSLVTCSGEWSQQQGTYLSRQFVRAILVD